MGLEVSSRLVEGASRTSGFDLDLDGRTRPPLMGRRAVSFGFDDSLSEDSDVVEAAEEDEDECSRVRGRAAVSRRRVEGEEVSAVFFDFGVWLTVGEDEAVDEVERIPGLIGRSLAALSAAISLLVFCIWTS